MVRATTTSRDERAARHFQYANTPRFVVNPVSHTRHPAAADEWTPPPELGIPKANGYTIYDGPSRFAGGAPVVAIVTGFIHPTTNRKTGESLLQSWILARDVDPQVAVDEGLDESICGDCVHRGILVKRLHRFRMRGTAKKRSCYVVVAQAPKGVWRAFHRGRYPLVPLEKLPALMASIGRYQVGLRIGAYGDPVAIPSEVWEAALGIGAGATRSPSHKTVSGGYWETTGAVLPFWTGYTHQWKLPEADRYKPYLMASVDTQEEQRQAAALGWRTFRVSRYSEPSVAGSEIFCPASPEGGYRLTCDACRLCMGACKPARHIAIMPHGRGWRLHEEREEPGPGQSGGFVTGGGPHEPEPPRQPKRLPVLNPGGDAEERELEARVRGEPADWRSVERLFFLRLRREGPSRELWPYLRLVADAQLACIRSVPETWDGTAEDYYAVRDACWEQSELLNAAWNRMAVAYDQAAAGRRNPPHGLSVHPRRERPVARRTAERELRALHAAARLPGPPAVYWPRSLAATHEQIPRRYAQVLAGPPAIYELAEQTRWLAPEYRRGLFAHEVGHVLATDRSESAADRAAAEHLGVAIDYDTRWGGRGLEVALNPPTWEQLPESTRARLANRRDRQLRAILNRTFPVNALWGQTRTPVRVQTLASRAGWAPGPGLEDARWLVGTWLGGDLAGTDTVILASSLYDLDGKPWLEETPRAKGVFKKLRRLNPGEWEELEGVDGALRYGQTHHGNPLRMVWEYAAVGDHASALAVLYDVGYDVDDATEVRIEQHPDDMLGELTRVWVR